MISHGEVAQLKDTLHEIRQHWPLQASGSRPVGFRSIAFLQTDQIEAGIRNGFLIAISVDALDQIFEAVSLAEQMLRPVES